MRLGRQPVFLVVALRPGIESNVFVSTPTRFAVCCKGQCEEVVKGPTEGPRYQQFLNFVFHRCGGGFRVSDHWSRRSGRATELALICGSAASSEVTRNLEQLKECPRQIRMILC